MVKFIRISNLTSTLDEICGAINEKVWDNKKEHYLVAEEITELINSGFNFRLLFSPFESAIVDSKRPDTQLMTTIIGMIWASSGAKFIDPVYAFFEYLLFGYHPISSRFNARDEINLINKKANVRRSTDRQAGILIMKQDFWNPILTIWKEAHPEMFKKRQSK